MTKMETRLREVYLLTLLKCASGGSVRHDRKDVVCQDLFITVQCISALTKSTKS